MKTAILLPAVFLIWACGGNLAYKRGEKAYARAEHAAAVDYFMEAVRQDPQNVRYRVSLNQALLFAANFHLKQGEFYLGRKEYKMALYDFDKALEYNPESSEARRKKQAVLKKLDELRRSFSEKTEIEKLKERAGRMEGAQAELDFKQTPLDLKLGSVDLKSLFRLLQKSSGVRFLFDDTFQSKTVSIDLEDVLFKEALEMIMLQSRLFYKIIDANTVIIVPNTPAKRREYDEMTMKTFFLSNSEPEAIMRLVGSVTGSKNLAANPILNTITVRDLPAKVAMVEQLIRIMDKPRPEVLINVEIIEVNKSRLREYGIELSQYNVSQAFSPGPVSSGGESQAFRGNTFRYVNSADFLFTVPSVSYKLLQGDTRSRIKANPQLRVSDQETVRIHLGDKVPMPTTTFVPNYSPGSPNQQPITSYQMQDVGIKIELTPRVHHDGWISLKLDFELTFITSPGTNFLPPTIGNRSLNTMIRLQDNETSLLAGLLRDTERKTLRGFPGLTELPVLKHIFSGNKNEVDQTDIILTITPRIIKFPQIEESDLLNYWVGTEEDVGLKAGPPHSPFSSREEIEVPIPPREEGPPAVDSSDLPEKKRPLPPGDLPASPAEANGLIRLSSDSAKIAVGQQLTVRVLAEDLEDLQTLSLELTFEPGMLELQRITDGAALKTGRGQGHLFKSFDNDSGRIVLSLAFEEAKPERRKELALLQFNVLAGGPLEIRASRVTGANRNQEEINTSFTGLALMIDEE